jgi:transcriptional regulator CtsR
VTVEQGEQGVCGVGKEWFEMSSLTDMIERAILDLIEQHDGYCEIARNAFATEMKVAPSQITYVISTRFGHEHGYIVESRRGGSGYIRIMRVPYTDQSEYIMHLMRTTDDYLTQHDVNILIDSLQHEDLVSEEMAGLMRSALSDRSLALISGRTRHEARSLIFKNMLLYIASLGDGED